MILALSILIIFTAVCLALLAMTDSSLYLYLAFTLVFMIAVVNIMIEVIGV